MSKAKKLSYRLSPNEEVSFQVFGRDIVSVCVCPGSCTSVPAGRKKEGSNCAGKES